MKDSLKPNRDIETIMNTHYEENKIQDNYALDEIRRQKEKKDEEIELA